jgi:hypothetical protein
VSSTTQRVLGAAIVGCLLTVCANAVAKPSRPLAGGTPCVDHQYAQRLVNAVKRDLKAIETNLEDASIAPAFPAVRNAIPDFLALANAIKAIDAFDGEKLFGAVGALTSAAGALHQRENADEYVRVARGLVETSTPSIRAYYC